MSLDGREDRGGSHPAPTYEAQPLILWFDSRPEQRLPAADEARAPSPEVLEHQSGRRSPHHIEQQAAVVGVDADPDVICVCLAFEHAKKLSPIFAACQSSAGLPQSDFLRKRHASCVS